MLPANILNPVDDSVRVALDRLVKGDGGGLAVLYDAFYTQLSGFYYKYQRLLKADLDEFLTDRLLELGDAWHKSKQRREQVNKPVHWCRRVLRYRCLDTLKRHDREDSLNPSMVAEAGAVFDDNFVDNDIRKLFVNQVLSDLDYEVRRAMYLVEHEDMSQTQAAKRLLEMQCLPDSAWKDRLSLCTKSPGFIEAKAYLLNDADACLLGMEPDQWMQMLGECSVPEADKTAISKAKPGVANRVRKGKFRFHKAAASALPEEPGMLREIWSYSWPNESVAPKPLHDSAVEKGLSEEEARRLAHLLEAHLGFLVI